MGDEEKATTKENKEAKDATPAQIPVHDSNPFTTTIRGVKKLLQYNTNALIGTILFTILLGGLLVITVLVIIAGLVVWLIQNNLPGSEVFATGLPPEAITFAYSMSASGVYATWAIGVILILLLGALMQAIQVKLVAASANSLTIGFGDLLQQSARRVLPLIGWVALVLLVLILLLMTLGFIAQAIGPIVVVLAILAILLVLYVSVRAAFVQFAIVEQTLGPIAALKRSWELTKGHFIETLGILAVTALFVLVPTLIFDSLGTVLGSPVNGVFELTSAVISLVVGTIAMIGFAERFLQLNNIKEGKVKATQTHLANYVAIGAAMLGYILMGAINAQYNNAAGDQTTPYYDQTQLEQELREFEQKSRELEQQTPNTAPDTDGTEIEEPALPSYNVN